MAPAVGDVLARLTREVSGGNVHQHRVREQQSGHVRRRTEHDEGVGRDVGEDAGCRVGGRRRAGEIHVERVGARGNPLVRSDRLERRAGHERGVAGRHRHRRRPRQEIGDAQRGARAVAAGIEPAAREGECGKAGGYEKSTGETHGVLRKFAHRRYFSGPGSGRRRASDPSRSDTRCRRGRPRGRGPARSTRRWSFPRC